MRRGLRFVLQLTILPVLWGISSVNGLLFQIVLAVLVIVTWPVACAVAITLVLLARSAPDIQSLTETADNAVTLALGMTALAALAFAVLLRLLHIIDTAAGQWTLVWLAYLVILLIVVVWGWTGTLRHVWIPMLRERIEREGRDGDKQA